MPIELVFDSILFMAKAKTQIPSSMDVDEVLTQVEKAIKEDKTASPALISAVTMMVLLVKMLLGRLSLHSKNSSKAPSSDQNKDKDEQENENGDEKPKSGGQKGHKGTTLELVDDPEEIKELPVDQSTLPEGTYSIVGYERRQVVDIKISRFITEYRAQILENEQGKRITASFPAGVTAPVQYGNSLKSNAVYMSQFQLIPYLRVKQHFQEVFGIEISVGSLYNFNETAYHRLEVFEDFGKQKLREEDVGHVDETGCNIDGKNHWIHDFSSTRWTILVPHEKRGCEAMDEIDILPHFKGVLCHDHWKPYFKYTQCEHALCNPHHIRELTYSSEQEKQEWALKMKEFLLNLHQEVKSRDGWLAKERLEKVHAEYQEIIKEGEEECPPPKPPKEKKRGRLKKSKSRNLLERLKKYETETLLFAHRKEVPFSNNQGERDLRMTKVHQKISGCFRSFRGAQIFCRMRSYLGSMQKQGMNAGKAMDLLFSNKWGEFAKSGFSTENLT